MNYQVVTKTVSAQPLAAVRRRALSRDVGRIWKPALDLVWEFLRRHEGLRADGHNCFLYHHPAHRDAAMDIDFGVQVIRPFEGEGEVTARVAEDVDLAVLTASQIKAIASGNPVVLEKVGLETELTRLDRLYATWRAGRNRLRYDLAMLPEKIDKAVADLRAHAAAIEARNRNLPGGAEAGRRGFAIELRRSAPGDETCSFTERELAGNQIRQLVAAVEREALKYGSATLLLGEYAGFEIYASAACLNVAKDLSQGLFGQASLYLRLKDYRVEYGFNLTDSDAGIIQSMDARLRGIDKRFAEAEETRRRLIDHRARIEAELAKGWEYTTKFQELRARLDALNASMRAEGLITEEPLHLAELAEEAFLPTAPESNGVPVVAPGIEQSPASAGSAADDQSLQIEPAISATSDCGVPVPASPEETAGHQSQEPRIDAALPTSTRSLNSAANWAPKGFA